MEQMKVKSDFAIASEQREMAIYSDFVQMMQEPGAMKMTVMKTIAERYGLFSVSAIWKIRKRVEKRLAQEKQGE